MASQSSLGQIAGRPARAGDVGSRLYVQTYQPSSQSPASPGTGSILVRKLGQKGGQAARLGGWISRDILKQQRNRLSPGVIMASQSSLGQIAGASGACG